MTVDNYTSKAHTVLQVRTQDRKGLLYDSLRATKDLKINVSYGKVEVRESGVCELDLFVGRNSSEEVERNLCLRCAPRPRDGAAPSSPATLRRLKRAIERPLVVGLSSKGVDSVTTELCVTAPMDAAGFARPRVLLDVTDALRSLGVMVFKADIHSARSPGRPLLEVHRFLLTDLAGQPIVDPGEFRVSRCRSCSFLLPHRRQGCAQSLCSAYVPACLTETRLEIIISRFTVSGSCAPRTSPTLLVSLPATTSRRQSDADSHLVPPCVARASIVTTHRKSM